MKTLKKAYEKFYLYNLKFRLKNKDFSIISNDCWGGGVYEDLNLPYKTPTVGLFFYAPCYIEFLENFNELIDIDLQFVSNSKYKEANEFRKKNKDYYPIGKINDIEIHFLHYKTEVEAFEKWNRRRARINKNNLFFKFSDRDLCTPELINRFDNLSNIPKVFFTAIEKHGVQSGIFLKKYAGLSFIGDIYSDRWAYRKDFDVINWLNNGLKQ